MVYYGYEQKILKEINKVLEKNDESSEKELVNRIMKCERVFVAGSGRSGLMGKAFAMRLMQIGKEVFVAGETITPSIKENDLFIAISGSGTTRTIYELIKGAREMKAEIIVITANKKSRMIRKKDLCVLLEGKTKNFKKKSIQPLGSLFEQSTLIFLDAVIIGLIKKMKVSETSMKKKHASLE